MEGFFTVMTLLEGKTLDDAKAKWHEVSFRLVVLTWSNSSLRSLLTGDCELR